MEDVGTCTYDSVFIDCFCECSSVYGVYASIDVEASVAPSGIGNVCERVSVVVYWSSCIRGGSCGSS